MVMTIQTALTPLLITGALCGLCVFEYPRGRPRPYFTCLYSLIFWSTYVYLGYYSLVDDDAIDPHWITLVILMSSFVSMMVSLFRFKELKTCLRELSLVDNTLEALGTPKEYRRLYKWMIGVIVIWVVSSNFLNIMDVLWEISLTNHDFVDICIMLGGNIILHIGTINGAISGTILGYMGSRFERVNKHIRNLLENDVEHIENRKTMILVARNRVLEVEECRRRVWIVMHVHLHLSILSRELNKVFSVQLTLEMASMFTVLIDMFFEFHEIYIDEETNTFFQITANLSAYIWVIVFTTKLLILNHICQTVCDKASETVAILYKLSNDNIDENLREQILQFILQIKQREVKFSGMGLFYFGNNFVRKFFTSMVTVLIIIIQFNGFNDDL